MAKARKIATPISSQPMRPALSEEARENQLCSLAYDLVEQRLRDGTASSQETTHFLKYHNRKAKLELDILEKEKELIEAKTDQLKSQKRTEELLEKAMKAFATYSGQGDNDAFPY
jgi:hypothetical protein